MNVRILVAVLALPSPFAGLAAAVPCTDGTADAYDCSHVDFVARLGVTELGGAGGEDLNDVWGWVDADDGNTEYALVGMYGGTAFVRLNGDNPPTFLGRLPDSDGMAAGSGSVQQKRCHDEACGSDSAWRDIKVYKNFAYIVSEAEGHGMQVFDLTQLRGVTTAQSWGVANYTHVGDFGNAHNIFINEDSGRAYVVGNSPNPGNSYDGGLRVYELEPDPADPHFVTEINIDGYTHDVQCVTYSGPDADYAGREICFASNEDTLTVLDVTDALNAEILSKTFYEGVEYAHQGWLSADRRFFFLNDEVDELETGERTHLRVFDVSNLDAPEIAAHYYAPTLSIDHNNYVHGRWLYQTNYNAGLRILDVEDPRNPVEAAYFDTQPATDAAGFTGTWSNFAFPSGLVALSDINSGLFLVRPSLLVPATEPDIAVAFTTAGADVEVDEIVDGEFVVSTGADANATDVLVTAHLPPSGQFVEFFVPQGWACESQQTDGRVMLCRVATLSAGSESTFGYTARFFSTGEKQLIAMAYANEADGAPADNLGAISYKVTGSSGGAVNAPDGGGGLLSWLLPLLAIPMLRRRK